MTKFVIIENFTNHELIKELSIMQIVLFKYFVDKYEFKNEATANVKILEILQQLDIPLKVDMQDDKFTTTSVIECLHPN